VHQAYQGVPFVPSNSNGYSPNLRRGLCRCMLLCHAPKKAYYKKFLFEPFPVESHLDAFLHDHLAAEVTIQCRTSATIQCIICCLVCVRPAAAAVGVAAGSEMPV
jgi:hypothetical protein